MPCDVVSRRSLSVDRDLNSTRSRLRSGYADLLSDGPVHSPVEVIVRRVCRGGGTETEGPRGDHGKT